MNTNRILPLAASIAALVAAGSAHALDTTHYAGAIKLYYGGATATDNVLENIWEAKVKGICAVGTIDVYRAANERVVLCSVTSAQVAGFPAGGQDVAFHKESQGGSANGPLPLIAEAKGQPNTLQWLDLGQLNAADLVTCTTVAVGATTSLNAYTDHPSCPAKLTPLSVSPNAGIADVEPTLLSPPPSASDVSTNLAVHSGVQIIFGIPVTTSLYRALQQAQGFTLSADGTSPGIAACNTNPDIPSCVPSLTRAQVRGFYTQQQFDWSTALTDKNGISLPASPLVSASFKPANNNVYICRRVDSSGTEASFESFLLRQRCEAGVPSMALPDDGSTVADTVFHPPTVASIAGGSVTNAAPSSGNVRTCLDIIDHNGSTTGSTASRLWGIGILSTEVKSTDLSAAHDGFRFVALDGTPPTLSSTINSDYEFFTDNTLMHIKDGKPGSIPTSDLRRKVIDYIEANLALPAVVADLDGTYSGRPWGDGGILSPPGLGVAAASPVSAANALATPIGKMSHATTGTTSNCAPAVTVDTTPSDTKVVY